MINTNFGKQIPSEILFRGQSKDNKKWVEGYYVKHITRQVCVCNDELKEDETQHLIFFDGFADWNMPKSIHCIEIIPETLGRYTGLKDKNKKMIFEGDIVDCWSEGINAKGVVQQRNDGLWIIYPAWQKNIMWGLCPDMDCQTSVEIIGNRYDNSELIKIKDEE